MISITEHLDQISIQAVRPENSELAIVALYCSHCKKAIYTQHPDRLTVAVMEANGAAIHHASNGVAAYANND